MLQSPRRVLLVEEDPVARSALAEQLAAGGLDVRTADTTDDLVARAVAEEVDVVVGDFLRPGSGGQALIDALARRWPRTATLVLTAYGTIEGAVRALRAGAFDYLQRPVSAELLRGAVQRALFERAARDAHPRLARHAALADAGARLLAADARDRIAAEAAAALRASTRADAALYVVRGPGSATHHVHAEGLPDAEARILAAHVAAVALEAPRLDRAPDGRPVLLAPARRDALDTCLVALGPYGGAFAEGALEDAAYLAEHAAEALAATLHLGEGHARRLTDDLTGLHTAHHFEAVLARELQATSGDATEVRPCAVLLLDLDGLRTVNERFGHLTGSKVLIEVARVMRRCAREVDAIFRQGSDEFALVLGGADAASAAATAERLRRAIETHAFLAREGLDVRVTASLGVARFPDDARTAGELVDLAERAVARSKRAGGNAVHVAGEAASA